MLDIEWLVLFLLLGCVVGFMAGLLGIGGGGIMVPLLTTLFLAQGVPVEKVVHLALGTSMASIIFTSLSSLRAHHAKQAVRWLIVKRLSVGILIGTFAATFVVAKIDALYLALFFSVFMGCVSIQLFLNRHPKPVDHSPGGKEFLCVGAGIGAVSALVSIGGGSLTVPYLVWRNIDIKHAIGTSAAIGLPISLAGTLGYLVNGWSTTTEEAYTYGFIYMPAVALISVASVFMAPIGATLAHRLPVLWLKKIFSGLLILLSIKMLLSVV